MNAYLQKALTGVAGYKNRLLDFRLRDFRLSRQSSLNIVFMLLIMSMLSWNVFLMMADDSVLSDEGHRIRRQTNNRSTDGRTDRSRDGSTASLFTRWGRTTCPRQSKKVYNGVAGGSYYAHTGGGSNYLCMPHDPIYGEYSSAVNNLGILYGAEYQTMLSTDNSPFSSQNARLLYNHNVPCVVCRIEKPTVFTLPGRNACYSGWQLMYKGYLASAYHAHKGRTQFVCVDADPEADEAGYRDENGALFYTVEGVCGALPCPPYVAGQELTCAVCAK